MSKKLIIVLSNTDPKSGEALSAPLIQAAVAASMSHHVEIIFTGPSAKLLRKGTADEIFIKPGEARSIYDFLKEAHSAGVKIFCCAPSLDLCSLHKDDLIPECSGVVGAAHVVEEIMGDGSTVLTY